MTINTNPNYWQDYTTEVLNGKKDRDDTLQGYTDSLEAIDLLQKTMNGDVPLSDEMRAFLDAEGIQVPNYDDNDDLNQQELGDLELLLVDRHEQVSLANAIVEGMENQILREISGTLAEKRNLFENEEEFI